MKLISEQELFDSICNYTRKILFKPPFQLFILAFYFLQRIFPAFKEKFKNKIELFVKYSSYFYESLILYLISLPSLTEALKQLNLIYYPLRLNRFSFLIDLLRSTIIILNIFLE